MSLFLVAEVIVSIGEITCGECEPVIRRKLKISGSPDLSRVSFAIYSILSGLSVDKLCVGEVVAGRQESVGRHGWRKWFLSRALLINSQVPPSVSKTSGTTLYPLASSSSSLRLPSGWSLSLWVDWHPSESLLVRLVVLVDVGGVGWVQFPSPWISCAASLSSFNTTFHQGAMTCM